jgi:riboflavin kinase/FMN adenylyltransferase
MTFEPHPVSVLRPTAAPQRLGSPQQRRRWLLEAGADEVVELAPTPDLLDLEPAAFYASTVVPRRPDCIVEGPDFRFGRGRAGDVGLLRSLGSEHGIETIVIEPREAVLADGTIVRVSSSMVRWLLANGRVDDAATCLGRPYELAATVVRGEQRGRTLGFPTANLGDLVQMLPADGVYAGTARRPDGAPCPAAISVGSKPTFDAAVERVAEVHLVDWDGPPDDYCWRIDVSFDRWLRDQVAFDGVEALVAQLHRDIAATARVAGATIS